MRIKTVLIVWVLLVFSCTYALAGSELVYDKAGLFTDGEIDSLSERAEKIGNQYNIDVAILTISENDKSDAQEYAEDFYLSQGFGQGVMLLIDMDTRNVWITVKDAEHIISDGDVENILDGIFEYLPDGDYYNSAAVFLDNVEYYFEMYSSNPSDKENIGYEEVPAERSRLSVWNIITPLGIILSLVAAAVYLAFLCRQNKTVKNAENAQLFMQPDSLMLTQNKDSFLRTHTTRTRIHSDNNSNNGSRGGFSGGSGGGGRSGGGFSGGGRSF